MERTGRLDRGDGVELAYALLPGKGPTVVFLPGFASDMTGSKATTLASWCAAEGRALLRLDYSGHGASGGSFAAGSIGTWTADARLVIERLTEGPLLLVGSSMGGWIALLTALAMPERIAALVGIAAAPDFTEDLMWAAMAPPERERLLREGALQVPSEYGAPTLITRGLIEDGRRHLLLRAPVPLTCPVRLLQGQRDADVPWETALRLAGRITGGDVQVVLVKDGDHRLSREQDLGLLVRTVGSLLAESNITDL
ncbi:2-hydroxymuconic semialdehyde hydrolase [Rhodovastum atsumiense]|uniref:Palmitoyl-protein thioesterase ABHD10, mitochondrial n=1 Tax=Rhodovastum atsumiense TaxID=504468 RepID=A0A5M6J1E4_9PROT|nr:alpha/beta hydrolase [Rhodovastum atsumiense]KAA5614324.1 alpha/beta hydrolase [Rhodovastum atsumiense]CAH2604791.1 2-hydroxymuconic semialdehyde hydrolase [Rhodovastum atsumiense]